MFIVNEIYDLTMRKYPQCFIWKHSYPGRNPRWL